MFTAEQIDAMSREMIAKAQAHYKDKVLSRLDPSALKTMEEKAFLESKLKGYITNAFLDGVAQAMSYIAAVLQRVVERKDDDRLRLGKEESMGSRGSASGENRYGRCTSRKKRYNEKFLAWIERKCQESGDTKPVNDEYYESFVSLTNKQIALIARIILHDTARNFNKKLFSDEWKSDDEMYEFVMVYLELIAEGRLAFDEDTGKMLFCKPVGAPPSDEMWTGIQNSINSSPTVIGEVVIKHIKQRQSLEGSRSREGKRTRSQILQSTRSHIADRPNLEEVGRYEIDNGRFAFGNFHALLM